jgi:hypothetical protein
VALCDPAISGADDDVAELAGGDRPRPRDARRTGACPFRPAGAVAVVHADPQLDQAPGGGGDEPELATAVTSGEPAVALVG